MSLQQSTTVQRNSIEQVSMWALFATLIAGLFVVFPSVVPTITMKTFLLGAGAIITLALYILARLSRGNIILPPFTLVVALWLPVAAYALSALFSTGSFSRSFWGTALESDTFGAILIAAVLGTLAAFVLRRVEHYRSFWRVGAIVVGAVSCVQILALLYSQVSPGVLPSTFSLTGSFDDLAYLLGLGIISILITFRFLTLQKRTRRALLAVGVFALVLLALANAFIVWVLIALVSLGLFVESVMRRGPKSADADFDDVVAMGDSQSESEDSARSTIMPLAILAVSLFFLIGGTLGNALAQAFHIDLLSVRPSWQSTFSVAQKTYSTSPVFGSGPNTFGTSWLKYRDVSLNADPRFWSLDFTSGIGYIPTSFVTTGVVGVLAWASFLILFLVFGLRMLILRAPEDAFVRFTSILSLVGFGYLFTIAVFGLPNTVILALGFVFAGIFVSTTRFALRSQQWGVIFSRSPRLGFVIVFSLTIVLLSSVVAAYTLAGRYLAVTHLMSANVSYNKGDLDAADRAVQSALSFAPDANAYQVQAGIALARLNQIVSSTTLPVATARQAFQTTLSSGINAALTSTRLSPSVYQTWLLLGNLYAQAVPLGVAGAYESAKSAYQKAQALNPTSPQIPYIIAQLDIAGKNLVAAKNDLKAAITLKQDYIAAIFLLSQLEVQSGNVKDALAAALAAAYFAPTDPNILFQVGILYAASNDFANAATAFETVVGNNPQFANARYFLAAVYARQSDLSKALAQIQAIAELSPENATAVATQLTALQAGKNPFPANLLSAPPTPIAQ